MTTTVTSPARDLRRSSDASRPDAPHELAPRAVTLGSVTLWGVAWLLLLAAAVSVVVAAFHAPFDFDAAYNLEVPRNVLHGQGYATNGALYDGKPVLFDFRISTGPTLLLPVAGAIALLGEHYWVYPVVPVLAWLAAVVLAGAVGRRLAGARGAWAAAASVVMLATATPSWPDSPVFGAGDVLGEYLAAALLLGAALALGRPKLAGLLLGLALLTKFLVVMAVPAFLVAMLLPAERRTSTKVVDLLEDVRERVPSALVMLATAMLPAGVWNFVMVASLGPRGAMKRNADFLDLLTHAGSGLGSSATSSRGPIGQVGLLAGLVPVVVVVLLVLACVAVFVLTRRKMPPAAVQAPVPAREVADRRMVVALLGTAGVVLTWWVFVSSAPYVRHVLPAVVVALPVVVGLVLRRSERTGLARLLVPVLLVVGLLVGVASQAFSVWDPPGASLAEQQRVARELGSTSALGWTEGTPALELGVFGDVSYPQLGDSAGVLVLGPVTQRLNPDIFAAESRRCGEVLVRTEHYLACRVSAAR